MFAGSLGFTLALGLLGPEGEGTPVDSEPDAELVEDWDDEGWDEEQDSGH